MVMSVGSLFSGIGGLELGLERTGGFRTVWNCEVAPYCCRVLAKHWPAVPNLGDVTAIDWSTVEPVDLICGGYPCQPFSLAGARRGTDDARHLWPYFADALRVLRPRYALLENVPGHLSLGFDRVLGDLAELGFDAEWSVVPACALGASHSRPRVFIVAHAQDDDGTRQVSCGRREAGDAPVASSWGEGRRHESRGSRRSTRGVGWLPEPAMDRVAHWLPSGVVRAPLEALGNAVVPQVAEWIGHRILEAAA